MGGGGQWKQEGRSNKSFQRAINQENLDKFLDGSGTMFLPGICINAC